MADWATLVAVACALYLVECLAWVDSAAAGSFRTAIRARWRCARGEDLPGNDRGGLALADPLNLRGAVVLSHPWPFSISPEGLTTVTVEGTPAAEQRYVAFEEIQDVRADLGEIYINRRRFVRAGSAPVAVHLAAQIRRVRDRDVKERAFEIKAAIAEGLAAEGVTSTWSEFRRRTRVLSAWCGILALHAFVVSPIVLFAIGPYPYWIFLLAILFLLAIPTAVTFFRTHARLYPASSYDRWVLAISMVVFPLAATRAVDRLSRDALSAFRVVAVAPMLCGIDGAAALLRRHLVDLRQRPELDIPSARTRECAEWFRRALISETEAALGPLKDVVMRPPQRDDAAMRSYCPRCHAQFGRAADGDCPECPGIKLLPWSTA